MNALLPLLAEEEADQMLLLKSMGHTGWAQFAIIFGAIGLVAAIIFLVVYCFRKKFLSRHRHHHHRSAPNESAAAETGGQSQKKSRRLRRSHRPLNPTLAQTRGLPPLRDEKTPPPGL